MRRGEFFGEDAGIEFGEEDGKGREDGIQEGLLESLECPVGLAIGGNAPAEIAISIAAQLLERRN